jgi:hypothetical protein
MVNRRKILVALGAGLFTAPLAAGAQPTGKVYRIGFIATAPRNEIEHLIKALDEGLRELGYVEGRNVVFERRFADGKQERLAALAVELVQSKVDIIVSGSNPVIAAIRQATATIPVVMGVSRDPGGLGVHREPRAPWRKHHRVGQRSRSRNYGEESGTFEGGCPTSLSRGLFVESGTCGCRQSTKTRSRAPPETWA